MELSTAFGQVLQALAEQHCFEVEALRRENACLIQQVQGQSERKSCAGLVEKLPSTETPGENDCTSNGHFDPETLPSDGVEFANISSDSDNSSGRSGTLDRNISKASSVASRASRRSLASADVEKFFHLAKSHTKTFTEESVPGIARCYKKFRTFFESAAAETLVGALILANVLVMAAELQFDGMQVGYEIGSRHVTREAEQIWPGADFVFPILNSCFAVIFAAELTLRFIALGFKFFRSPSNFLDMLVVAGGIAELVVQHMSFNPTILRLLRLAKLARGLRIVQASRFLYSLHLLIRCVMSSVAMLGWSLCLITIIQCIAGMLVTNIAIPYMMDEKEDVKVRHEIWQYYGTWSRTMLTMFEVLFANWAPSCRILVDNVSEWFSLFFIVYRCLVGFAVLNVVNAVFVQQTMQVAQADVELAIRQKEKQAAAYTSRLKSLFHEIDGSADGDITIDQFVKRLEDKRLQFWMSHLELDTTDVHTLFNLLDDGDGNLKVDEFLEGALRLRGAAKSIDLAQLNHLALKIESMLETLVQDPSAQRSSSEPWVLDLKRMCRDSSSTTARSSWNFEGGALAERGTISYDMPKESATSWLDADGTPEERIVC